jgi:hypothetical protein
MEAITGLEQSLLTAFGALAIALLGYVTTLITKQKVKLQQVSNTADDTHKIVNSQRTEMTTRIDQLQASMVAAGIAVPPVVPPVPPKASGTSTTAN